MDINQHLNRLFEKLDGYSYKTIRNISTCYFTVVLFFAAFSLLPKLGTFIVGGVPLTLLLAWQINRGQNKSKAFVAQV